MPKGPINGVTIKDLRVHLDQRGKLFEMVRIDDPLIKESLGEIKQVYCTTVNEGVIKAWHLHKKQTDCMVCVKGNIMLGLYDSREDSTTKGYWQQICMGEDCLRLVTIPVGIYHGFKGISKEPAFIINTINNCYNANEPDEFRAPWDNPVSGYTWERENF